MTSPPVCCARRREGKLRECPSPSLGNQQQSFNYSRLYSGCTRSPVIGNINSRSDYCYQITNTDSYQSLNIADQYWVSQKSCRVVVVRFMKCLLSFVRLLTQLLYVREVVTLQKKYLIYLHQKMRFKTFINHYDTRLNIIRLESKIILGHMNIIG